jgi:NADH-quinone oxidoreductase subunit J
MNFLHLCLINIQVFTCLLIVLSRNPIHSVLFLILLFFESTIVLLLFYVEFLGLLLILIYVGAVAVLFLFVIMLLQVKVEPFNFSILIFFFLVLIFVFFCENILIQQQNFWPFGVLDGGDLFSLNFDCSQDIDVLCQILFNYYSILFLTAGLLLLASLIGVVVLLVDVNKSTQSSVVFRRLVRADNFISWSK